MSDIFVKDTDGPTTIVKGSTENKMKKILLSVININYNLRPIF